MATIGDVARRVGVAPSTVSHALTGKRPISAETRARVLTAAAELGYQPNAAARTLALRCTRTVGLALPLPARPRALSSGPYFEFVAAAADRLAEHGYTLLSLISRDPGAADLVRLARGGHVDGMLLMQVRLEDPRVAALRVADLPFVTIGRTRDPAGLVRVDVDFAAAAETAVGHLVALGHRRIAFLGGAPDYGFYYHALDGFRRAHAAHGLPLPPDRVLSVDAASGLHEALRPVLDDRGAGRVTALVTVGDLEAATALHILVEHGLRVPDDLSIVALYDSPLTALAHPPLTALRSPAEALTAEAVDLLLAMLAGRRPDNPERLLSAELVVRGSTSPAHPAGSGPRADRTDRRGDVGRDGGRGAHRPATTTGHESPHGAERRLVPRDSLSTRPPTAPAMLRRPDSGLLYRSFERRGDLS